MSDEKQDLEKEIETKDQEQQEAIDPKEFESLKAEKEAMQRKLDELLSETKKAKQARRDAEEAAKREAEEKARKDGDFEQLLKSSEEKRQELESRLNEIQTQTEREKTQSSAYKIAAELADGANAELLSEFVARRLKVVEGEVKVTDENGNLTVSSVDELKKEFANSDKFKSLLRGNQSSGGGATGSKNGGGATKKFDEMTSAELVSLRQEDPAQYEQLKTDYYQRH